MQIRNVRNFFVVAVVMMVAGAFSLAVADQVVYFANGKAIMVKKVEQGDEITILEMEGGGRLGVPTAHIVRIEEYAVSKPHGGGPPAAPAPRAAARTTPSVPPGGANPGAAADVPPATAVNQQTNLVAEAPSVVPERNAGAASGLAAPREAAPAAGTGVVESGPAVPPEEVVPARPNTAAARAAALAAQQSRAAKLRQDQRDNRLNNPRGGRNRAAGAARGQALMGGQTPRRPGQGTVQGGASVPAGARSEEEIVPAAPDRRRGKNAAAAKTPPPPPAGDEKPKESPSEAN